MKEFRFVGTHMVNGSKIQLTVVLVILINGKETRVVFNGEEGDLNLVTGVFGAFAKATELNWLLDDYSLGPKEIWALITDKETGRHVDVKYDHQEDPLEAFIKALVEKANEICS